MKTRPSGLLALLIAAIASAFPGAHSPAISGSPQTASVSASALEAVWTAWFVEMTSPPTADGTPLATVRAEKAAFRSAAARAGLQYRERYAFDVLWNGLSIDINPAQVSTLSRTEGVKAIYPVVTAAVPEPVQPGESIDLLHALAMTGADIAQNTLGLTGRGVRVAILDSGVDYDHPDLGGCFGPGCRVFTGYDFVGDDYDPSSADSAHRVPHPDDDPDDCNGHGTHVAGIVGANGVLKGVAPDVTFGAYRVFGCGLTTQSDITVAAMERALADHMQVLNMSLGSAFQWPEYPTSQASTRLVNNGVVVVAAIGNESPSGLYAASAPGTGAKVIGVASFDNTHLYLNAFTVTPANLLIGYFNADSAPAAPLTGSLPLVRSGTSTTANDACNVNGVSPFTANQFAGQAVLIRRGACSFYEKSWNAQNAGAAAVVLYNNVSGFLIPTVAAPPGSPLITIPVVATATAADGVAINDAIAAAAQTLAWQATRTSVVNPTGGLISGFSSYGVAADLTLKPDIGAPGGWIYSTYPLELGGYTTLSGTSMASPHVAGAVALLLQARPSTPAQSVRAILQNSADPHLWWGNPSLGFLDNVHRQGAGMLDIDDAILATTQVEPGKLELGESEAGPALRRLTIRNNATSGVTYDLSHVPALSTGPNTFAPSFTTGFASVAFSAPSVLVPAGGTATVDVTITANAALAAKSLYGGYIVLTPHSGGPVYRVPYAGFTGDYQSIQVLKPTPAGFPLLGRVVDGTLENAAPGTTFTMTDGDVPYVLLHLDHQARRLRLDVADAVSGKSWFRALDLEYVGRNSTATSFFAISWDGTTTSGKKSYVVPDGRYIVTLSVLKALGDPDNPAHWETWTSPALVIHRP